MFLNGAKFVGKFFDKSTNAITFYILKFFNVTA